MKKVLWTVIFLAVATGIVYFSNTSGRLNLSFLNFGQTQGFEAFFDEAASEIKSNQNLAAPAIFAVSSFENIYGEQNGFAELIETELRNSMAQAMPGRVAAYRNFPKIESPAAREEKKEAAKEKKGGKNASALPREQPAPATEASAVSDEASAEILRHSGHFIINGTYKEEDGMLAINMYIIDAENGMGYYARRIDIPAEKVPAIAQEKTYSQKQESVAAEDSYSFQPEPQEKQPESQAKKHNDKKKSAARNDKNDVVKQPDAKDGKKEIVQQGNKPEDAKPSDPKDMKEGEKRQEESVSATVNSTELNKIVMNAEEDSQLF